MLRHLLTVPASCLDELTRARLALESWCERRAPSGRCNRALVTVCRSFPIYSQTFVHRELSALLRSGFSMRLLYSKRAQGSPLHDEFRALWRARRRDNLNSWSGGYALWHFRRRMPERVGRLTELIAESSGLAPSALLEHKHFRQAFAFARLVEACRPDYLHSYFFYERSLMALVTSYLLGIPRGVTCYADHMLQDYELKVVRLHLRLCDVVVATSRRIRSELLEIAPDVDPGKILLKPNAIPTSRFPLLIRNVPDPGEPFHIVSVCRIEPKKGLLEAVSAVAALKDRGLPVVLHLVGEADETVSSRDYERALHRRVVDLRMADTVRLEGRHSQDGVRRFLASAQLFIAPFVETSDGDKDGIPTALLEAMATGLPTVVTDAGSMLEVVEDGANGVVVPQRDAGALATAIEQLLRDPERRRRLGRNAAEMVQSKFDVELREKEFHERLAEVLAARAPNGTPTKVS